MDMSHWRSSSRLAIALLAAFTLASCGGAGTPVGEPSMPPLSSITRISTDPFSNVSSQHATEVESALFASGLTIVAAFQSGRFFSAGSSDIGFATSRDGGASWTAGFLPGITRIVQPGNPFDSVSDPAVAFDAAHGTWLIASLPIDLRTGLDAGVLVSRSSDGLNWSNPVGIDPSDTASDKNWIVCDNTVSSPFYGHCYVEWDDGGTNGLIHMSTSRDGGVTWTNIVSPSGNPAGIGGQPLVQPNGTVIVPIDDFNEATVLSFVSHDGGVSWTAPVIVSPISSHFEAAGMRSGPLPTATMDAVGKAYGVWQHCRFRTNCASNDLVLSTSNDGVAWTPPSRVPIDPIASVVDHFIPGLGIDPMTSGAGAHLGLTYYYFDNTNCTAATCRMFVGFIGSQDGGATWSGPVQLAGPMNVAWLPQTLLGLMVGDYIATVFSAGRPLSVFAVANAPSAGLFDEAMYAPRPGSLMSRSSERHSSAFEHAVPHPRSEYPLRHHPHRTP